MRDLQAARGDLLELLRTKSFAKRQVTLASGKKSNFYIDCKQSTLDAVGHVLVGALLFDEILRYETRIGRQVAGVGGLTLGADPIASAVSMTSALVDHPIPALIVRKEPKGHGTGAYLEGAANVTAGGEVVVVEDVVTTGGSALKAVERVRDGGFSVRLVLGLVDRLDGGRENLEKEGLGLVSLFDRRDFLSDDEVEMKILLALACLSFACAAPERLSLQPRPGLTPDDYEDILDVWTRDDRLYDKLDSLMFVFGTFHSPEFRRAFLLRHSDVYGPGSEMASHLTLTDPEAEQSLEFFLSVSTAKPEWNELDKNKDSIWRVTLTGEGNEVSLGIVERIRTTANIRAIYPYITDFAKTYRVRFPLTSVTGKPILSNSTRQLTLHIVSALGAAELTWEFQAP